MSTVAFIATAVVIGILMVLVLAAEDAANEREDVEAAAVLSATYAGLILLLLVIAASAGISGSQRAAEQGQPEEPVVHRVYVDPAPPEATR